MFASARRFVLIILLLLGALGLTWGQRWIADTRLSAGPPPVPAEPMPGAGSSAVSPLMYTYFADVEGWYRVTAYETVVRSPIDFSADSTKALGSAIPTTLGEWQQIGMDQDITDDEAVVFYLKHPTVGFQRTYQDPSGQSLTLTIIGNKGDDSFLLFSHTPETCYPGQLWQVVESRQESALLDDQPMYAQYLLTQHTQTGQKLMVLFWYLWDDPQRDSQEGVLSVRLNLFIPPDKDEAQVLAHAWDFVRLLFPSTVPWERF